MTQHAVTKGGGVEREREMIGMDGGIKTCRQTRSRLEASAEEHGLSCPRAMRADIGTLNRSCNGRTGGWRKHTYGDMMGWDWIGSGRHGGMTDQYIKDATWAGTTSPSRRSARSRWAHRPRPGAANAFGLRKWICDDSANQGQTGGGGARGGGAGADMWIYAAEKGPARWAVSTVATWRTRGKEAWKTLKRRDFVVLGDVL